MARFFQPKKKTICETKHQTVLIERLDHQGAGIAYQNKKPIFVEGALPHEKVLIQLTESKSKFSRGNLIKVLTPSEQRVTPFCAHYTQCGGCDLQHLAHDAQIKYKQQTLSQLMSKFAGETVELSSAISMDDKGYRRRARISLFWDKKQQKLQIGFRKKQSKQIVTIEHCAILAPALNALLSPLNQLLLQFSKPERLGHVELVQHDSGTLVLLRHIGKLTPHDHERWCHFAKIHNVILYFMSDDSVLRRVIGEEPCYSEVGVTIPFSPSNFIQVNAQVNQAMVAQAIDWLALSEQDRVLDLFCGLGNFSLPIAKLTQSVVGVEGVDSMVEQAKKNALLNQIHNIQFYQANLEQEVQTQEWVTKKFDKIILDPARAGAMGVVTQLHRLGAKRVVYVSCNPSTLARDSQSLLNQGYRLEKLNMLDIFPHTSHLESMALFVR